MFCRDAHRRSAALGISILAAAAVTLWAGSTQAETTLRAVMASNLAIIDPHWTSALVTRSHGYMIYDTLFAMDAKGEIKPQMVESYEVSPDKLTYTFRLREGLLWHDGNPVTSEDCIASLKRWGANDPMGKRLLSVVREFAAIDDRTFRITLTEPVGFMLTALGKPLGNVPFIMPKRVADTDPAKQITETIGSGPFMFKRDEWQAGYKAVYVKFDKYKPRSEPPSGLAGGKVVNIERIEWIAIRDHQQEVNALLRGEVDYLEFPLHDLLPVLKADPHIKLVYRNPYGNQLFFRPNWLHKPFDNAKIRQALWYAFNQEDFLIVMIGNPDYYTVCKAYFGCGTALGSEKGMDGLLTSNVQKARQLLKEGGYDGTPVVLLQPTDVALFANLAPMAKQLMEQAGFRVELQAMDMQTMFARRARKDPPSAGGWNGFLLAIPVHDVLDPLMTANFDATCGKAPPGWPCDAEMERLRDQFARETDPAKRHEIADAVQVRGTQITTHIPLGQWRTPHAMRSDIEGNMETVVTVFWGMSKREAAH